MNIARAVIRRPRLLLLDEPTASLDVKSTGIVLDILKELRSRGTTMVGIFHDPDTLNTFADEKYDLHLNKNKTEFLLRSETAMEYL